MYNQALSAFKLGNLKLVKSIAITLTDKIETNVYKTIDGYEVGHLFYLLEDYQSAANWLIKHEIDGIDLFDWKELSYSLYITDKATWETEINRKIKELSVWIEEIENKHKDWENSTKEEKQERLTEFKNDIALRKEVLLKGMTKPNLSENINVWSEYCSCLLFDCNLHGNRNNDN